MARSISTKRGDDGTTGLLYGGRVPKTSARIECNGAVDEAQAAIGLARAQLAVATRSRPLAGIPDIGELLVSIERELWVLMAEVATAPRNRRKLVAGSTLITREMVDRLEAHVHELEAAEAMPAEFVVPGEDVPSAALDLARTVVRRAERLAARIASSATESGAPGPGAPGPGASEVVAYLNRLSDLLWLLARFVEEGHRTARARARRSAPGSSGSSTGT
ncbi:MAG: cob(I)yrinic acid a,c-diamide adenosyltransferase [Acidimicrobiales bacterium]